MIDLLLTLLKSHMGEGMAFWQMLLYPDIFNYLMFYPTQLGTTDLND